MSSRAWCVLLLLAPPLLAAPHKLAEQPVTIAVAVAESISIESADNVITFANLAPETQGWSAATDAHGDLDTCYVIVGANAPAQISYLLGSALQLQDASTVLSTQFATQTMGRGDIGGTPFDTGDTWGNNWSAWEEAGGGGAINFEPGRFGLMTKAQVFRQGLNDPSGTYVQTQPFSVVVSLRH